MKLDHIPVMLNEVLKVSHVKPDEVVLDLTFGLGGYSKAFIDKGAYVIGIDRDINALPIAEELKAKYSKFSFFHEQFSNVGKLFKAQNLKQVDIIVMDFGLSSVQIDNPDRGFSFRHDGPLSMQMGKGSLNAADVINNYSLSDLRKIIKDLGNEKYANLVASAIVSARDKNKITTTKQLADIVRTVVFKKDASDPATRTFQAIRIFVNNELEEIKDALNASIDILKPGGRIITVSFHSLEDKIVKDFFAKNTAKPNNNKHMPEAKATGAIFKLIKKGVTKPSKEEINFNPRARSAMMRYAIKI